MLANTLKHDPFSRAKRRQEELRQLRKVGEFDSWSTKGSGGACRCDRRREHAQKKAKSSKYIQEALDLFDYNNSKGLNYAQLKDFLRHLDTRESAPDPTEAELKWIIQLSTPDQQRFDGEWVRGEMQLEGAGLETAAKCWISYTETVFYIDPAFDEFDADKTGNLSRDQLSHVLARLNEGLEPCIDDVDFVMSKADVIGDGMIHKPELVQAISIWYSIDSEEKIKHHAHRQHASKHADEREEQFHRDAQKFSKKSFKLLQKFDADFQKGAKRAARRQEHARQLEESRHFIAKSLAQFDKEQSGGLKFQEIGAFLQHLDTERGIEPSEAEIKWIIQMCTPEHQLFNGEWVHENVIFKLMVKGEMQLEGDSIHKAATCWLAYTRSVGEIEKTFEEISEMHPTKDGDVDKKALEAILTKLNEGVPPQEADLDYVMDNADRMKDGVLHRPELVQAISLWYLLAGRDETETCNADAVPGDPSPTKTSAPSGTPRASSSACCALQ